MERLLGELPHFENDSAAHEARGIVLGWAACLAQEKKRELYRAWKSLTKQIHSGKKSGACSLCQVKQHMVASGACSGSGGMAIVRFIAAQLGRLLVFFKKKASQR